MPIPKVPEDLRAKGVRRTAYDMLHDAIVRGDLAPGERLYDEVLEARFGTTRSAVRSALAQLEDERLVRIAPRKGTFVTELDLNRGLQAVEVLAGVTMRAMRDAEGRLSPAHVDRLVEYRDRWLRAGDTMREALLTSQEDDGLYGVFFEVAGNLELDRVRAWVLPYVRRVRHHLVSTGAVDLEHAVRVQRQVVAAIVAGDVRPAAERLWESTELFGEYSYGVLESGAPRRGVTLSRDLVADRIEKAILDGTLVPDEPLPETELMAWLGVSHTPVRQALDALANRGLVEQQLNRSARVARLDPASIRDTFVAYGVLIRVALRRGMRLDPAGLAAAIQPLQDRFESEPDVRVSTINADINLAMFEFSGAQVLVELSERMASRLTWYVRDEWDARSRRDAVRLAAELREAIRSGDAAGLDRIVREAYEDLPFGA